MKEIGWRMLSTMMCILFGDNEIALACTSWALDSGQKRRDCLLGHSFTDYVDENVSTKVVKIIQSYTGIVNKMVWRKF